MSSRLKITVLGFGIFEICRRMELLVSDNASQKNKMVRLIENYLNGEGYGNFFGMN